MKQWMVTVKVTHYKIVSARTEKAARARAVAAVRADEGNAYREIEVIDVAASTVEGTT